MPAGRPLKPLSLLQMSGAVRKNPQRFRERQATQAKAKVKVSQLGDAPADWIEGLEHNPRCRQLVQLWNEIVAQDVLNVLNGSHRILVENTCHLMYKIRRASMGYGKATSGDYAQVKNNLSVMGMTPVDSPRVAEAVRVPDRGEAGGRTAAGGWGELVG